MKLLFIKTSGHNQKKKKKQPSLFWQKLYAGERGSTEVLIRNDLLCCSFQNLKIIEK